MLSTIASASMPNISCAHRCLLMPKIQRRWRQHLAKVRSHCPSSPSHRQDLAEQQTQRRASLCRRAVECRLVGVRSRRGGGEDQSQNIRACGVRIPSVGPSWTLHVSSILELGSGRAGVVPCTTTSQNMWLLRCTRMWCVEADGQWY